MLSPRVVLVTGAARRIGRAIALHLASQGWSVAVHSRQSRQEAEQTAADCVTAGQGLQLDDGLVVRAAVFSADLADEAACRALLPAVQAHFGRVDAVVNNASLFEHDDAASFSYAAMERHWRANTAPAIVLAQALKASGGGVVVNLLDQKLWNLNPDHLSYTLSKAALQTATTMLAQALAPTVRVCAVAPGVTLLSGPMSEAAHEQALAMTPLGYSSKPADIARSVAFLLDSPAITGTTLLVDGGEHLTARPRDVAFLTG